MEESKTSETAESTDATDAWQPNEELLEMLIGMGISKIAAEHALYYTGNQSAEAAASYVFDNPDIDVMTPCVKPKHNRRKSKKAEKERESDSEENDEGSSNYKMVFVVNMTLSMGIGKIASQVAHACLGIYKLITEFHYMNDILSDWEDEGEKKIVLKGENHVHLQALEKQAQKRNLFSYLIHDAGKTQIPPNSVTVLALFGPETTIDLVTGDLSLL